MDAAQIADLGRCRERRIAHDRKIDGKPPVLSLHRIAKELNKKRPQTSPTPASILRSFRRL